jgi:hypothetical protein
MKLTRIILSVCVMSLPVLSGISQSGIGNPLHLKLAGDSVSGFRAEIYQGNRLQVTRSEEFSLTLSNLDHSVITTIPAWKGQNWSGNDSLLTLTGDTYIKDLDANLKIAVTYQVMPGDMVRKTIRLSQPSMPDMYYILKETNRPAESPLRYCSFEYDSFPGGFVHEMFPSAGWITNDNKLVGFLTDAGYKNQYSRGTRRRFSGRVGGLVGLRKLPDPELFSVATNSEREHNDQYIRLTYGEMYNLDAGSVTDLKIPESFTPDHAKVHINDSIISLNCQAGTFAGMSFFPPFSDQHVYTITFLCKGNAPLALKMFRLKNGIKREELEDGLKYIDAFPTSDTGWTVFKGSILIPYIAHDSVQLSIGTVAGKECWFMLKDLKIQEHQPERNAYNILPLGKAIEKTSYIFFQPWKSHQDFMIASQVKLAEGKGFQGSEIEKMLYGNFNALTWITSVQDFTPFNVPNMNYMPDMYNRDCFFAAVSTYNEELNISLWNQWSKTQTTRGAIGTIITPYMGSVEAKDNEASIEWLVWAMLNKRRFGYVPPEEKIKRTVDYILHEFDSAGDGICHSHFPLCQVDIIDFNPKTDRLAVNQGMLAIALRTIRELGYPISNAHIEKAEQAYLNFYDIKRKHLLFDKNFPDLISLTDLEPEFFSLWLFNRPILTDDMVINHLNQIPLLNKSAGSPHPEYGTTAPILIRLTKDKKGYAFLTKDYQPFEKFGEENYADGKNDGFYYNGGSWFRPEYCAYVTGLKHGWNRAKDLMENRIWAEINLNPNWPFSKEFIPTRWTSFDSWWPSTRGLCWNVFILMADEVAGLRKPEMDPDYKSKMKSAISVTPIVQSQN